MTQIVHLRTAVALGEPAVLPPERLTQVFTNLGNLMSHCGRVVEALAYWDRALQIDPNHGMARGNRGYGLERLATLTPDPGHQRLLLRAAYVDLQTALDGPLESGARPPFKTVRERIENWASPQFFEDAETEYAWADNMDAAERAYREWSLSERLFLNDLNELGAIPIAAADVLVLPSFVTPLDAGPDLLGFYNQLKQEYVSARYLLYAGISALGPHFSDREVTLINTLDYPAYGFATEQVKIAFRMAYSLLDKIAYFLNDYLKLGIPLKRVSFKTTYVQFTGVPGEGRSGFVPV